MLDTGWPVLLAMLSFLLNMNLSDSLFGDVLGALQSLTTAARCLTMPMPCGAFFIAFIKAALPPHVVAALDESPDTDNALTCWIWPDPIARAAATQGIPCTALEATDRYLPLMSSLSLVYSARAMCARGILYHTGAPKAPGYILPVP
jgi:hypothetical protein